MALRLIRISQVFQKSSSYCIRNREIKSNQFIVSSFCVKNTYCTYKADNSDVLFLVIWNAVLVGWKSWKKIVIKFIPVGLCLIAVMQWRAYRKLTKSRTAKQWEVDFYCSLPLRALSRCWGSIADMQIPALIRPWVYGLYASTFGVNILEAESSDLKDYPTLGDFFARGLKDGVRSIDFDSCLVSPCDGKVLHCGPVNTCYVEQVKGVTYSLEKFLGDNNWQGTKDKCSDYRVSLLERPENKPTTLFHCVLYLGPGDYHRFHSPTNWEPSYRRHFFGELLSVNPVYARWIPELFCLNERAVYLGKWKHGFFSFAAVGATNVGRIKVYFDNNLQTNLSSQCKDICLSPNIKLEKGDPIGEFRMGSTIVLIFEAPSNFEFNLVPGERVQMGQGIGCVRNIKYVDKVQKPNYNVIKNAS